MLYHVAFTLCAMVQGGTEHCESEKIIDTLYNGLVSCYSAANEVDRAIREDFREKAKAHNVEVLKVEVKTQCLTITEGEAFLKKEGPSALIITGKKFE